MEQFSSFTEKKNYMSVWAVHMDFLGPQFSEGAKLLLRAPAWLTLYISTLQQSNANTFNNQCKKYHHLCAWGSAFRHFISYKPSSCHGSSWFLTLLIQVGISCCQSWNSWSSSMILKKKAQDVDTGWVPASCGQMSFLNIGQDTCS